MQTLAAVHHFHKDNKSVISYPQPHINYEICICYLGKAFFLEILTKNMGGTTLKSYMRVSECMCVCVRLNAIKTMSEGGKEEISFSIAFSSLGHITKR